MNFEIAQETQKTPMGDVEVTLIVISNLIDPTLMKVLLDITEDEEFYNETVKKTPEYFFQFLDPILKKADGGNEALLGLACYLSDVFKDKIAQYNKMSDDGRVTFDHLNRLFTVGSRFVATVNGQLVGGIVHATRMESGMFGDKHFMVVGMNTLSTGKEFVQMEKSFCINQFGGLRHVKDLEVCPMSEADYHKLTERGRKFARYGLGTHYLAYDGEMFRNSQYGPVHFNATGRLMVDPVGFRMMNPNYERQYADHGKNVCNPEIPEELLFLAWPFISGWSSVQKRWGEIYVEGLKEIVYDEKAFDYLVLDPDVKQLCHALVTNVHHGFTDIISQKSGGAIFLLHGPPGTGKTLMCESISEVLHRPLYSVTVGEMGTSAEALEKRLAVILEVCRNWDAVILIDEADIFLEKRSDNDIERNAMVGIFLRLLERHQGVMFLTTNRAERLDEAFRSRISIIIQYDELNEGARLQVWRNLSTASKLDLPDEILARLSAEKINGRQIKNAIRMSMALAHSKKEPVTYDHLIKVIRMM